MIQVRLHVCITFLWLFLFQPASANPNGLLAIIIDDLGYDARIGERLLALPGDITVAILPQAPHSQRLAALAVSQGKEVILHTPMSNTRRFPLDPGGLTDNMTKAQFYATLADNFSRIPQARGLNNHMGSLLTQQARPMGWLMEFLGKQGAYFVDSRTTAATQARQTANHYRVPSLERDIFLDNDRDPERIRQQLARAIKLAQAQGYAVAIGHPYPETLHALETLPKQLAQTGVALTSASRLLSKVPNSLPADSRRVCLAPPKSLWYRPPPLRQSSTNLTQLIEIKISLLYTNSIYSKRG